MAVLLAATAAKGGLSGASGRIRALMEAPVALRTDCLAAALILIEGREARFYRDQGVPKLRERGVVRDSDLERLKEPATRGYASLIFCRAMGERLGAVGRLFAASERYSYRHLEFLGLIASGGPGTVISGPELVALLSQCQTRMKQLGRRVTQ